MEGTPEMVLEVISPTSVHKDTIVLQDLYWRAGIKEYWVADPRREGLSFDILKHGPKGFVTSRKQDGWIKSAVFGKSFASPAIKMPKDILCLHSMCDRCSTSGRTHRRRS